MDSDSLELNDAIRSELPGRIRLRLPMLRGCSQHDIDWITQWIKSHNENVSVNVNPLVGSILLTWDTKSTTFDVHPLLEEARGWFEAVSCLVKSNFKKYCKALKRPAIEYWIR